MSLASKQYVQPVDIQYTHQYTEESWYQDVLMDVVDEDPGDQYQLTLPIHRTAQVEPDDTSFNLTTAYITLSEENISLVLPDAPSLEFVQLAHENILSYLEQHYEIPVSHNCSEARYNIGFGHPLLALETLHECFAHDPIPIENPVANGLPEGITFGYELSTGTVYGGEQNNSLHMVSNAESTETDVQNALNDHLFRTVCNRIDEMDIQIYNPHDELFDISVLYPAFYKNEVAIHVWNEVADELFNRNLTNTPTPDIRTKLQTVRGLTGDELLNGWLRILAAFEYEMPLSGPSWDILANHAVPRFVSDEESIKINWHNGMTMYNKWGQHIESIVESGQYAYTESALPTTEFVEMHHPEVHTRIGVKPIAYQPHLNITDSNEVYDQPDKYFWTQNAWYVEVLGFEPCEHKNTQFDATQVRAYFDQHGTNEFATKQTVNTSQPIDSEALKSMTAVSDANSFSD